MLANTDSEPMIVSLIKKINASPRGRKYAYQLVAPLIFFLLLFFIMQPGYIGNFSNGFFLDNGDGFQNVWNIWWVDKALTIDHVSPYFTNMLHWPHGVSLVPQTMNIYNGLIAIPLMHVLKFSLIEAVNFAVVSAFVMGGLTMFWFIQKLHKQYWVSLIGGALFTFSSYHFAHAQGHLQLVTLQFIPLFLLAFWTFLEKLRYKYAFYAAGSLFLVMLCDYYYLMWCVIVGGLWVVWKLYRKEIKLSKKNLKVFSAFAVTTLILVGPLLYRLVHLNKTDPLIGGHDPLLFSLDPLMVFIPGGSWYWHTLTDSFTSKWQYFAETGMFFGVGLLTVLTYGLYALVSKTKRRKTPSWITFWWYIAIIFGIMSLGPRLTVNNNVLNSAPMPYAVAEKLFPTLQISGMPVRWILITLIAAIVIATYWLSKLNLKSRWGIALLVLFVSVTVIDLWPRQLPLTQPTFRKYVYELKKLPYGAVIDNGALTGPEQLYNQTLHGKPQAFGYVTRLTKSVDEKDFQVFAALEQMRYDELCSIYKIRYVTLPTTRPLNTGYPVIYQDDETLIYDLKNSPNC